MARSAVRALNLASLDAALILGTGAALSVGLVVVLVAASPQVSGPVAQNGGEMVVPAATRRGLLMKFAPRQNDAKMLAFGRHHGMAISFEMERLAIRR